MKRGSHFVALSRGKTYDLPSKLKALDGKLFAGAGVDVTDLEPLASGHAHWEFENATITPRVATQGGPGGLFRAKVHTGNIARFAVRKYLINIVDMGKEC